MDDLNRLYETKLAAMSPAQRIEHAASHLRSYAYQYKLTGAQMDEILEAGILAMDHLRPEWWGRLPVTLQPLSVDEFVAQARAFAERQGYTGEQLALIFSAGCGPAQIMREDIFAPPAATEQEDRHAA